MKTQNELKKERAVALTCSCNKVFFGMLRESEIEKSGFTSDQEAYDELKERILENTGMVQAREVHLLANKDHKPMIVGVKVPVIESES
ncbi:MAG: hypothetical protein WC069_00145 [Candidatus Shapirobacteria bacterium]